MKRSIVIVLGTAASIALAGCQKSAPPENLPPQPTAPPPSQPAGPTPGSQQHFVSSMNGRDVIYFDTDMYDIDEVDAAALRAQAQWLMQYPQARAKIEGHCDERGTREYNLALGQRRADAAKNYLVGLGIDASRLSTVSYGKERPVAIGSNPEAWAKNRRAVTITLGS